MKRLMLLLFFTIILFLSACSENKEDIVEKTLETEDTIESYATDYGIAIDVKTEFRDESSSVQGNATIVENPAALHQVFTSTTSNGESTVEGYMVGEDSYINEGDVEWIYQQIEQDAIQFEPSYKDILNIIDQVQEHTEFTEQDSTYQLSFEGFNREIYDTLASPFNVELTGFNVDDDVKQKLVILINKEDHTVQALQYDIAADNQETGKVTMDIHMDYNKFNEVEEITIPEEVKDSAS
ncbi:DUF6612 family protein [Oceanobacillus sp. 1P07AA]|uniref:DUF6612 family protein n=1 Tax=Oceanobacillus sp. 1P07AA TaxID=3132293 RepID=UPI0039A66AB3